MPGGRRGVAGGGHTGGVEVPALQLTPVRRGVLTHLRLDDWAVRVPRMPGGRPYMTRLGNGASGSPLFGRAMCGLDVAKTPNALRAPDDTSDAADGSRPVCGRCRKELRVALRRIQGLPASGEGIGTDPSVRVSFGSAVYDLRGLSDLGLDVAVALATVG